MGTAVSIEIVPRAHAILSASSADRWLTCTPSARIEEALPEKESAFAADGTAAHAFAEVRLRYLLGQITKAEYLEGYDALKKLHAEPIEEWTAADWGAIDSYIAYVRAEADRLGGEVHIEARVDYSKYAEGGFGTSDVLIVSPDTATIKSIDLKFGKGVPVMAEDNSQARLYALGGILKFDPDHAIKNVEWAIVQPRLDYVGEGAEGVKSLLNWAETVVAPAAKLAWAGEGELKPSAKACRFCKASATCRARVAENVLIARRDFMPTPDPRLDERLLGMDEVARILPDIDAWIQWANALKQYALEAVRDRGEAIEGYKLVRGRSARKWIHDEEATLQKLKALGVSETQLLTEPSLKSVAQVEKAMGPKAFADVEQGFVTKSEGAPTLVPEADPRAAMNVVEDARKQFSAKTSTGEK